LMVSSCICSYSRFAQSVLPLKVVIQTVLQRTSSHTSC